MNVGIPRGSLGVPKHQRDCVPRAKGFHYQGEQEYHASLFHPPQIVPTPLIHICTHQHSRTCNPISTEPLSTNVLSDARAHISACMENAIPLWLGKLLFHLCWLCWVNGYGAFFSKIIKILTRFSLVRQKY